MKDDKQKQAIFEAINIELKSHNRPEPDEPFRMHFILEVVSIRMPKQELVKISEIGNVILKKLKKIKIPTQP